MSTVAVTADVPREPGRRPGYWRLFFNTAGSQIIAGIFAFALVAILSVTSQVGVNMNGLAMYAPWVVDGPWPLVANLAWGSIMVVGVSAVVRGRLDDPRPSRVLTMAAVAIAGYSPWLVATSARGRAGLSLLLLPAALAVIGYDAAGRPRRLPRAFEPSTAALLAALASAALLLVVPYALLHPFAVRGEGMSGSPTTTDSGHLYSVRPGKVVQYAVAFQGAEFPITVTGARLLGDVAPLRIIRVTPGGDLPILPFNDPSRFPLRFGVRRDAWIGWAVTLRRCPRRPAAVAQVRVSYRELGLALSQTVALGRESMLLRCPS